MTSDNIDSAASCRHTLVDDNNNDNDNSRRQTLGLINASIHVRHVERNSQNCKFGNVQCWLACDDTASINLYIDLQKELDYVEYKLTQNIRRVFRSEKTRIQLDLNTRLRLDIIITHEDQCQQLFEQLNRIKARPDDCDSFPRHQPKTGIARLDVGSVYLTAKNDLAPQLSPFTAGSIESSTSSKKRAVQHFIPTSESEHTIKKTRSISSQDLFKSYRQSNEVVDSVLSTSPPAPQTTPEKWRTPSSPTRNDVEIITPRRAQLFDEFTRVRCSTANMPEPVPKPRFHAKVPTPRVLRSMNDKSKRYGREVDPKSSKDSRVLESRKFSGSGCIYMSLLAMLCLNPVVPDLTHKNLLNFCSVHDGLFKSLIEAQASFAERKHMRIKEEEISHTIVKSSPGSLGGDVDDARVFFVDCLNQIRREFPGHEEVPISKAFTGKIDRVIECTNCGNVTRSTEQCQDLQLEIPTQSSNSRVNQDAISIGSLVPQFFDTQPVECQKCHYAQATVHRSLSQLPEVIVLCLKRFSSSPTGGYKKHRAPITIDATLEFTQFCSEEAFVHDAESLLYYQDDFGMRPHIPSDSLPSSSSSPFSSVSPRGQHDLFRSSPSPTERYMARLKENDPFGSTFDDPIVLDSDDEDAIIMTTPQIHQSFSFYEAPTEEEQYQWAMEESIRASQLTSSQTSIAEYKLEDKEDIGEIMSSQIFDDDNPFANPNFASMIKRESSSLSGSQKSSAHSSRLGTPKISPKIELPNRRDTFVVHEDKEKGIGRDSNDKDNISDDGEEDDENIKAALLASLMPIGADIEEQEKRQVEEAIRLSLLDQEENKENISPEKSHSKKKILEKKKKEVVLERSISQLDCSPLDRRHHRHQNHHARKKVLPAQLKRSNTIDFTDRHGFWGHNMDSNPKHQSFSLSQSPSPMETSSQPIQLKFPPKARQSNSKTRQHASQNSDVNSSKSAFTTRRVTRASKGKDRASSKTSAMEHQSLGLFKLQAIVSHTSLSSSSPATTGNKDHYICDQLGMDGIWRSNDGTKIRRMGTNISDINQYRARSGYLFFYVRSYPGTDIE